MKVLNVTYHKWVDIASENKVKLIRCTCCNPPRYAVVKGNVPLISTYYKEEAQTIYLYEKSRGDDDNVF